jgi:hypothetical protein
MNLRLFGRRLGRRRWTHNIIVLLDILIGHRPIVSGTAEDPMADWHGHQALRAIHY